jgi:hypothetical protein
LDYSSYSGLLLGWLKGVRRAYSEVRTTSAGCSLILRALKKPRDEWAHSAAVIDAWLTMKEQGVTTVPVRDPEHGQLRKGR